MKWFDRKNKTFSRIVSEDVTNKEVMAAHLGFLILIAVCALAEWLEI